ncbi:hypothetical protein CPC08DRAFT_217743 [Agrocybe pediades]|nr:hypothetical protein CPC08DRAFT_217743 [Agrocybe pediades]
MSEQSPPPPPAAKPKPGSLRDRIAAFEKSATSSNAPPQPPAPRPKPAGFATWKPKPPSPPSSPSPSAAAASSSSHTQAIGDDEHAGAATTGLSTAAGARSVGTMSASDAKESITKGGSLKERMAALQGKGAFGAPAPASGPPPRPAGDKPKPKWKPPPPPPAPAAGATGDDDQTKTTGTADIAATVQRTLSPPISISSAAGKSEEGDVAVGGEDTPKPKRAISTEGEEGAATETNENDGAAAAAAEAEGEPDPEEERQRRAAIAARMARLGGARVGMAPPVFGMKPPVRKLTQESVEAQAEAPAKKSMEEGEVKPADIPLPTSPEPLKPVQEPTSFGLPTSPPLEAQPQSQSESESVKSPVQLPTRKDSTNISILSADSDVGAAEPHAPKQPTSMPVPAVPRRAGPPRKKPAKPTASPPEVPAQPEEDKNEDKDEAVEGPKPLVTNMELPDTQIPAPEAESVSLIIAAAEEAENEKEKENEKEREQDETRLDEATPRPGPPHVNEKEKDEGKQGAETSIDEKGSQEKAEDEAAAAAVTATEVREEEKPSPYNPPSSSITTPSLSSILNEEILQSPPPSLAMSPSQTMTASVQRQVSVGSLEMAIERKIGDEVGDDDRIDEDECEDEDEGGVPKLPAVNSGEEFGVDLDQVELGGDDNEKDADDVQIVMESAPRPEPEHAQEGKGLANSEGADIDEEEEEAARKKRVAERIAKMGGVNPFALPPPTIRSPPLAAAKSPSSSSGGLAPVESATLEDQDDVYARALETSGRGAEDTKAMTASVGSSEKEDEDDEKEKLGASGANGNY